MEKIMNEENEWGQMVETDVVERPVEKVARNEIVEATQKMKSGKATGPFEVTVEMIVASGEIGVKALMELCESVLDGRGMSCKWKTRVIVPIFEGKCDGMSFFVVLAICSEHYAGRCIYTASPLTLGLQVFS